MSVGTLHQINSYANIIYAPLLWITFIPRNISNFLTSLSKIFEILEENPEVQDIKLPIDIRIEGEVNVKNVTFGYESYNPVLENVSFHVNPGEMIGIVGHSGSGKTTLINLLMRLYDVNEGAIEIDDVNIKDISQNALENADRRRASGDLPVLRHDTRQYPLRDAARDRRAGHRRGENRKRA